MGSGEHSATVIVGKSLLMINDMKFDKNYNSYLAIVFLHVV